MLSKILEAYHTTRQSCYSPQHRQPVTSCHLTVSSRAGTRVVPRPAGLTALPHSSQCPCNDKSYLCRPYIIQTDSSAHQTLRQCCYLVILVVLRYTTVLVLLLVLVVLLTVSVDKFQLPMPAGTEQRIFMPKHSDNYRLTYGFKLLCITASKQQ